MKKKFTLALSMMLMAGLVYDYNFRTAHTNGSGAGPGNTGSPGDGMDCGTSCHTGGPAATDHLVTYTSDIPGTGYVAGNTYNFTVTATKSGTVKFGFQLSPQDFAGDAVGTLIAGTGSQLVGGHYLTHSLTGTTGSGSRSWNFQWIAPASGTGSVTFYGAFNFTNNSQTSSGDVIVNGNHTVLESTVGISDVELASLSVYPNPAIDQIHVSAKDVDEEIMISMFNIEGKKVLEEKHDGGEIVIDLRAKSLNTGVYFMQIEVNGKTTVKKLMLK